MKPDHTQKQVSLAYFVGQNRPLKNGREQAFLSQLNLTAYGMFDNEICNFSKTN